MMTRDPALEERLPLDPILARKVALLEVEVGMLEPRMNAAFWEALPAPPEDLRVAQATD